ncbi:hypothetical protein SBBP2_1510001 [Burkholderiales bacterium]|nr:hypothetical protein SBBP2_1510001 [Burkholderiales bacterium]
MTRSCGGCRHFLVAAKALESAVPGLKILSSAFGSVRADTGLCQLRDFFCVPDHRCPHWQERSSSPGHARPFNPSMGA